MSVHAKIAIDAEFDVNAEDVEEYLATLVPEIETAVRAVLAHEFKFDRLTEPKLVTSVNPKLT